MPPRLARMAAGHRALTGPCFWRSRRSGVVVERRLLLDVLRMTLVGGLEAAQQPAAGPVHGGAWSSLARPSRSRAAESPRRAARRRSLKAFIARHAAADVELVVVEHKSRYGRIPGAGTHLRRSAPPTGCDEAQVCCCGRRSAANGRQLGDQRLVARWPLDAVAVGAQVDDGAPAAAARRTVGRSGTGRPWDRRRRRAWARRRSASKIASSPSPLQSTSKAASNWSTARCARPPEIPRLRSSLSAE